jgi:hypothetical protein
MPNRSTRRDLLLVLGAALFLALLALWLLNQQVTPPLSAGNDQFGICFISAPDHLADEARYQGALATGARWDRWPLYWHWVDQGGYTGPHAGGRHDYDRLVIQELAHGLSPIVILMGTPDRHTQPAQLPVAGEATGEETELLTDRVAPASMATSPPTTLSQPIFADGTDEPGVGKRINSTNAWAAFVFTTVERYRPGGVLARQRGWPEGLGIRTWEVWNEPDYTLFWTGTTADYYRLLEVAYKTIKTADPEATVLMGGLAFYDKPGWFIDLLQHSGGNPQRAFFDVLSLHHYVSIYGSERLVTRARAVLEAYGLSAVPIWITESGLSVWDDYPATLYQIPAREPLRGTMQEQTAYILQNSALSFYYGVERYYHFMLHDDCGDGPSSAYGLRQNFSPHVCNPAQGHTRPAYAAYQLATEQFDELIPLWRERGDGQDQVAFYRPQDKARVLALWATSGVTVTTTISATGEQAQLHWIEMTPTVSGTTGLSRTLTLTPTEGVYTLTLLPATNQNSVLPDDPTYQIGGPPYLLVEPDNYPPIVSLTALPSTSTPHILVRWQGEDRGSGIAGYDLWISQDDQPFSAWLTATTTLSAAYTGEVGHEYSFMIQAQDRAGNESPLPAGEQITTRVIEGQAVAGVVLDPAGQPVEQATVTITGPETQVQTVTGKDGSWPDVPLLSGEYNFQVAAPGYSAWPVPRRLHLESSANLTLTLAPLQNAVAAGDFEGNGVWQVWEWPQGQISLSIDAFDGQAGVRLGDGRGETVACSTGSKEGQVWTLQQKVNLPTGQPLLSFMAKIATSQAVSEQGWLEVALLAEGERHPLIPPETLWQATDWRLATADLSQWAGKAVDLQFQVTRCSEQPLSVTLDRVSIGEVK